MRYVFTEKAKEKSRREKDKDRVGGYFSTLYPEEYSDLMVAEEEEASRKEAEAPSDERR